MHNLELILTLAAGFIAALVLGYGALRVGWSPIVGYLLAGVLVGPHTPGFVANQELAEQLAEVGVILLMFGVGLHFHLRDLMAVRGIAVLGAVVQSAVATGLGALAFHAFGMSWQSGLVFGLALSVASTVVLIRVLSDRGELQSPTGRIAVGWLVVEDLFTVFILVLLPVVFDKSSGPGQLPKAVAIAGIKVAIFIAFTLLAGGRAVPWILNRVADTKSRELFTLSVLSLALGIAVTAATLFGVSMALGAFLAGMVVGQSEFSARAGAEALPMRDAFAVMFFLSVGLLFNPVQALASLPLIAVTLAIVLIGKPLAAVLIIAAIGYGSKVGLGVGLALAQVGEFSFLLATMGRQVGALPASAMNVVVATAIVSIMLNPFLYRSVGTIERILESQGWLFRLLNRRAKTIGLPSEEDNVLPALRAVVVGYGPIGQLVTRILRGRGIEPTVIEMNMDTYRTLRDGGSRAVYGDATQQGVLQQAGVPNSASLILSASGAGMSTEAVRLARELNPDIHVVARADYLGEREVLRKAGADEVFSGEGEVALAIADSILRRAGATPDQLDEARRQIRSRFVESPLSESSRFVEDEEELR